MYLHKTKSEDSWPCIWILLNFHYCFDKKKTVRLGFMLDIVRSIYAIVENENRKCSACKMVRNSAYDMSPKRFVYFSSVDVKIFPTILILVIFFFYNAMTYTLMHIVNRTRQAYNLFESRWVPENNIDSDSIDSDEQSKIRSFFFSCAFERNDFPFGWRWKWALEREKERKRKQRYTEIEMEQKFLWIYVWLWVYALNKLVSSNVFVVIIIAVRAMPRSSEMCVWEGEGGLRIHHRNFCEFCPNISQRQNINHNFTILLRRNVEQDAMMEIELFTYALFQPIYTISSRQGSKFTKQIYFNLTRKLVYISKSKWKVSNRRNSKEKKQHQKKMFSSIRQNTIPLKKYLCFIEADKWKGEKVAAEQYNENIFFGLVVYFFFTFRCFGALQRFPDFLSPFAAIYQ